MRDETGLPNDCGLVAAAAWKYLDERGIKARILSMRTGKLTGHSVVIFEASGRLRAYDWRGTLVYNEVTTWKTSPLLLARAWAKAEHFPQRVVAARWR